MSIDINKRTKGEWNVLHYPENDITIIAGEFNLLRGSNVICKMCYQSEQAEANAAFIVTACNNHDKLIKAIKKVNNEYNYALKLLAEAGGFAYSENAFSIETKQLLQSIEKETL